MKRYLFSLMAGALLLGLTTGCSSESVEPAAGDDGTVTITLTLPSGISSRAYSDGLTATKLTYAVYDHNAATTKAIINKTEDPFNGGLTGTVSFKLVTGKTYDILFWADSYGTGTSPYTFDSDAQTITVDYTGATCNDESRDAFFAACKELKVNGSINQTITLTRPFAQVNFGTDDLNEPAVQDLANLKASVTTKAYTKLNLLSGEASEPTDVTFDFEAFPTSESFPYEPTKYQYVAMNYLLMPDVKETLDALTLKIQADGVDFNTVTVPNAPVQRNYRTNIYGSLLTSTALFNIVIDPIYAGMYNQLAGGVNELTQIAAQGGSITLTEDVALTTPLVVAAGTKMELNLNGKSIAAPTGSDRTIQVQDGAELVIDGDGTVGSLEGDALAVCVLGGKLTINGGTFNGATGASCIYLFNSDRYDDVTNAGSIEINGGTFQVAGPWTNGFYYVLNVQNGATGTISVKGGTFINYNPAQGDDTGTPASFVADGYTSTKTSETPEPNGTWTVTKNS